MKLTQKLLSIILAISIFLTNVYASNLGDGDNDGKITATDSIMALNGVNSNRLDVNSDGIVNEKDSELILQKALNKDFKYVEEDIYPKMPEVFKKTKNVNSYADLINAISELECNTSPSAIYITDDILCTSTIKLGKSNANLSFIGIPKADGSYPSLDFSPLLKNLSAKQTGIIINGSGYSFKNLIIEKAGDCGIRVRGENAKNCIFENLIVRYNNNSGISITQGGNNNTIRCCDIYRNCDFIKYGSDADGVSIKLNAGENNFCYNVRCWENSDDGWDSYNHEYETVVGYIAYVECMAYHNGDVDIFTGKYDYDHFQPLDKNLLYVQAILENDPDFETKYYNREITTWPEVACNGITRSSLIENWRGNPNGYKFGSAWVFENAKRYVKNCLAFGNGQKGFDQNNSYSTISLSNTVSFDNGLDTSLNERGNYRMERMTATKFKNAVSFGKCMSDTLPKDEKGNTNSFNIIEPSQEIQAEIRETVDKTFNRIIEAVSENKILGEVLFDIYDYDYGYGFDTEIEAPPTTSKDTAEVTTEITTEATTEATTIKELENIAETKIWDMSDEKFSKLGYLTKTTVVDGLTLNATDIKPMNFKDYYIDLYGKGSRDYRSLAFNVSGKTQILITAFSPKERILNIADSEGNILGKINTSLYTSLNAIEIDYTGDVYIYSENSGIQITKVQVKTTGKISAL